jgi:hypothetical protein
VVSRSASEPTASRRKAVGWGMCVYQWARVAVAMAPTKNTMRPHAAATPITGTPMPTSSPAAPATLSAPSGDNWDSGTPNLAMLSTTMSRFDDFSIGLHDLRDVIEPVRLYRVDDEASASDLRPPRTRGVRSSNLPVASGVLLGREADLEAVVGGLATARVVTLTGAGGIGKTRFVVGSEAAGTVPAGPFPRSGVSEVTSATRNHVDRARTSPQDRAHRHPTSAKVAPTHGALRTVRPATTA